MNIEQLQADLARVTAERDAALARLKDAESQEPSGYQLLTETGWMDVPCHLVEHLEKQGRTLRPLYASPIPAAPAVAVPEEWRKMLAWLIDQRGKPGHAHRIPSIWDVRNRVEIAGKPCETCAMYDRARALLQSAPQPADHSEQSLGMAKRIPEGWSILVETPEMTVRQRAKRKPTLFVRYVKCTAYPYYAEFAMWSKPK